MRDSDAVSHHLAQLNIGRLVDDQDSPTVADFVDNLDRINAIAERQPGYVWRLIGDDGVSAMSHRIDDDRRMITNLTVWESLDALKEYVFRTEHVEFLRRRREWFEPLDRPHLVCWWVPAGHRPTLDEAMDRLAVLEADGPSPRAFTMARTFPPA